MPNMPKKILGIDPGFGRTGWGVIECENGNLKMIDYGCIETNNKINFSQRLLYLHQELLKIIKRYKPQKIGLEEIFINKNLKTAIKVGQARGVIMLTAIQQKIPIVELTPLQVKQGICSYGKADKVQVQQMVKLVLGLKQIPRPDDAADALAIAVCVVNFRDYSHI